MVGGPVQSDRPCYVERAADGQLLQAIIDQRFAYVLNPRATGKSSLMAHTIGRLRREGQLAAVVDLAQIGARGETADSGRWYYSIAYRIVRELRLKVDLQAWWQDKSALGNEQRLVEFFWDIVLMHTKAPVTIFFDEVDRAVDLPFADELFYALRSCYMRRISEPDYSRLNFVVLGVATPEQLCADPSLSPFTDGVAIDLRDFSLEESFGLAPGFGADSEKARILIERIHQWTRGHPYLTQKVARRLARRDGKAEDVDAVVRDLLLTPAVAQEEPLLGHIRTQLDSGRAGTRQALAMLGRIAKGALITRDPHSAARTVLMLIGIVKVDESGYLRYRNPIFERVFDAQFSKSALPIDWRRPLTFAAVAAVAFIVPYWYTQVLPQPYISTLTVVSQDFELARSAYDRLRRLPGFGGRADELLAMAMVRRSEQTDSIADVLEADGILRSVLSRDALADSTLAGFWLRQARSAMHRGDRDSAIIYSMAASEGQPNEAGAMASELIGEDYPLLESTLRTDGRPVAWEVDWERNRIVVVDEAHRVQHFPLRKGVEPGAVTPVPGRLSAVQHVAIERELTVDADGVAGAFSLLLTTQHARASDLVLRLTAPSGAVAEVSVPQPRADQQLLIFSARPRSALAALASEPVRGQWRLMVVDRRSGEEGALTEWALEFSGSNGTWRDTPESGITLPDPVRTEQVSVTLGARGRAAVAIPSRLGATGAMSVWDLSAGRVRADIDIETPPDYVAVLAGGARLLALTGRVLTLWDVDVPRELARIEARSDPAVLPAISPGERYIAFAEPRDGGMTRIVIVDTDDGREVRATEQSLRIADWALGPEARFLGIVDGSRRTAIVDPATGQTLASLLHQRPLTRVFPYAEGDLHVAADVDGTVVAWPLEIAGDGMEFGTGRTLGVSAAEQNAGVAAAARRVAFAGGDGVVEVRDLANGRLGATTLRIPDPARFRWSPDGESLVVESDSMLRRWRVDPAAARGADLPELSAVALAGSGDIAVLGYRGGYVHVRTAAALTGLANRPLSVDYIGHRGPVTSVAINEARNIVVSGGSEGVVRIWDLASVSPNEYFLRHPSGPIRALEISADGRWIASGAEYSARIWDTQTGELVSEIPVSGTVTALAFTPSSDIVAVGDSAGNIFLGAPRGSDSLRSARAGAPIRSLAFAADAELLASGDAEGNLVLWDVLSAEPDETGITLSGAVAWIDFSGDASTLFVRSGPWMHEVGRGLTGLTIRASHLLPSELGAGVEIAMPEEGQLRVLSGASSGRAALLDLEFDAPVGEPLPAVSPLLARNWAEILGLELDPGTGNVRIVRN